MRRAAKTALFLLCLAVPVAAFGQTTPSAPAAAPAAAPSFQSDWTSDVDFVSKRLVDLANTVPAEKYGWRPAPGVRSVGEVYMHVTIANYFLPQLLGGKLPDGFEPTMETKVTDKAKVTDWLKKSIDNARTVGGGLSNADLDKKVAVPFLGGRELTKRRILMIVQTHLHEHLGQSIAYARSIGVTPPWTEAEQAPPPKK
ncbi:MAG: DinB family protein [Acidobacteriota bacterium]|nr:DinB family protein [Acidobacteriota bacterium]